MWFYCLLAIRPTVMFVTHMDKGKTVGIAMPLQDRMVLCEFLRSRIGVLGWGVYVSLFLLQTLVQTLMQRVIMVGEEKTV
ncbi:hypothetical protein BDV29DRAFT_182272, partial [Aspergillus leporis]